MTNGNATRGRNECLKRRNQIVRLKIVRSLRRIYIALKKKF